MEDANTLNQMSESELCGSCGPTNTAEDDQKFQNKTDTHKEINIKDQNKVESIDDKDSEKKTSETADGNEFLVRKMFVHSQWLSVLSPYFKALFYSGMKETYSKEVVMKIYEHELEAHLVLIEAMYRLDVLKDKDYHLIVQVLVLAHKYDVSIVIKKCKYVLLSTAPNLEMCEYILQKTEHLPEMTGVNDMLQTFLVKEFTPFDKTWTTEKFTGLSKAALRLLLKSDDLATQSENTIFVALIEWVSSNIVFSALCNKCDLLDVVRFEFMSVDFLYDVVQQDFWAQRMPGFTSYLQKGLAYHGFSETRREQLKPKPKKRQSLKDSGPTFSWVIDDNLEEKLSKFPGKDVFSDKFWHQGYSMQLNLSYLEDLGKCSFYLAVLNLKGDACLCVNIKAKSSLFSPRKMVSATKWLYTADDDCWGYPSLGRNQSVKSYTIDFWVELA